MLRRATIFIAACKSSSKLTSHGFAREARVDNFTAAAAEFGRVRRIEEQFFESVGERAGVAVWIKDTAAGQLDEFGKSAVVGLQRRAPRKRAIRSRTIRKLRRPAWAPTKR